MDTVKFLEGQDPNKTAIVPAVESTLAIRKDLNGRGGFDLDSLDDDIQEEILQTWVRIIEPKAREYARKIARESLGLFWAQRFPATELPTEQMNWAVNTVLPPTPPIA